MLLLTRTYLLIGLFLFFLFLLLYKKRREIVLTIRENPRLSFFLLTLLAIVAAFLIFFVNAPGISLKRNAAEVPSTSFLFFHVGENTILTKKEIKNLDKVLGQHRLENLTPISPDFIRKGWLPAHFPEFAEIHAFFAKEGLIKAVASKTLKLDYRYTAQHVPPFTNAHFVFSDYSKKPLFIRLRLAGSGEEILKSIEERHGPPESLDESHALSPVLFWRNRKDLLVFAVLPDRYGKAETSIFIVYGDNCDVFREDFLKDFPEPAPMTGF